MANEVTLSMNEAKKLGIIKETLAGRMTAKMAAEILHLSERQIYRLRKNILLRGDAGIVHGNRDRTPLNAFSRRQKDCIITLYKEQYKSYNFTHFAETLEKEHKIKISRETVREWLRSEELGGKIRKSNKHRKRRLRKASEGEMLFLDGSPHHWFGREHSPCTLLLTCDDATGKPLMGLFREQEDRDGCFLLLGQLFKRYGLPQIFYLDRASQFKTTRHNRSASAHVTDPTQFQRAMEELSIQLIFSKSPQARGRIERMNGTFQNRLVAELDHHGITTLSEANGYLNRHFIPDIAQKFGVPPRDPSPVWRALPPRMDLFDILCVKVKRTVTNDNTISYNNIHFQLFPAHGRQHFAKAKVEVRHRPDGSIRIFHSTLGKIPARRISC